MFTKLFKSNKIPFDRLLKLFTTLLIAYTFMFIVYCFHSYSRTVHTLQSKFDDADVHFMANRTTSTLYNIHSHIQPPSKSHDEPQLVSHGTALSRRSSVKDNIDLLIRHAMHNIAACSWSHSSPQQYPVAVYQDFSEVPPKYMWFLELLKNKTDLLFHLNCGSLLGAYRHGGAVPHDADHDLIIPIWLNLHELGYKFASCPQAAEMALDSIDGTQRRTSRQAELCGRSKVEWIEIVKEYLLRKLRDEVKVVGVYWWGMEVHRKEDESVHVDLRVNVMEPEPIAAGGVASWIMNDAGPVCRCRYGTLEVWCGENANATLRALYGADFMRPDRAMTVRE